MIDLQRLKSDLIKYEGLVLKPYTCPAGKLTIGVGRNLQDNGITEDEAFTLLETDIRRTIEECSRAFPFWFQLNDERKHVLVSMVFNMGLSRVKSFTKMITFLEQRKFREASSEMMKSLWASQVKKRAVDLAEIMKSGEFPENQISD